MATRPPNGGATVVTFVLWDEESDGVVIKHDGEVVWRENSFDRLDQYLRHVAPLGEPVTINFQEAS